MKKKLAFYETQNGRMDDSAPPPFPPRGNKVISQVTTMEELQSTNTTINHLFSERTNASADRETTPSMNESAIKLINRSIMQSTTRVVRVEVGMRRHSSAGCYI